MTQVFDENGVCHAATVLKVEPNVVSQVRDAEKDGYVAVQLATGKQKEQRLPKAQRGHLSGAYQTVKEFRPDPRKQEAVDDLAVGTTIDAAAFAPGDAIMVSAISKGKGFQGGVKRHGFSGGPKTHGNKHHERAPGSIGATGPARVFKGTKMAGRMGGERITVKNLKVLQVDPENNLLLVSGAVPGRKGALVEVRSA